MTLSVGRPRSAGRLDLPDNLIPRPRGNVVYWYWRDPRDGIEKPLKCQNDRATAIRRAKELNSLIAQQQAESIVSNLISAVKTKNAPFNVYAVQYLSQLDDLAPNTIKSRRCNVNAAIEFFQSTPIIDIGVPDMAALLKKFTSQGKHRMAQSVRSTLIDMWKSAYADGTIPANHPNPALIAKRPKAKIKRARLILESFNIILDSSRKLAEKRGMWMPNSMLFGIVTAQRPCDLITAQFKRGRDWMGLWQAYQLDPKNQTPYAHVHDGYFWIVQQKTGALVKIPLSLHLNAVGMAVGEVIDKCRSRVASRYILHHTIPFGNAPLGSPICSYRIAHGFQDARDATDLQWPGKEPPPYYEIRSLSERLYSEQGIDTQSLLGHKHSKMTEVYADPRQADWKTVG